jgi:hypothetical protein
MSWNYRIFKTGPNWYQIKETYYDKDGKVSNWTKDACTLSSESIDGLEWQLKKMKKAFKLPVLNEKD